MSLIGDTADSLDGLLETLETSLDAADPLLQTRAVLRLTGLLARLQSGVHRTDAGHDLDSATDEEMFNLIGREFGLS